MKPLTDILDTDRGRIEADIRRLWDQQTAAELDGRPDRAKAHAAEIDKLLDRLPRPR